MNIFKETTRNLTDVFMHYVCMRLRFRASVWRDEEARTETTPTTTSSCQCC